MTEAPTRCLAGVKGTPWSPCKINGKYYLFKFSVNMNSYVLCASDFNRIYFEELGDDDLTDRCEALNPDTFEMTSGRLLKEIQNVISKMLVANEDRTTKLRLQHDAECLTLKVTSCLVQLPFCWHFVLTPGTTTDFWEHMTVPLVAMAAELHGRQEELIKLIKRKDAEIDDYKNSGGKVPKYLETKLFDEDEFLGHSVTSQAVTDGFQSCLAIAFGNKGQDLYKQVITHLPEDNPAAQIGATEDGMHKGSTMDVSRSNQEGIKERKTLTKKEKNALQQEKEIARRAELDQKLERDQAKKKKKKIKL